MQKPGFIENPGFKVSGGERSRIEHPGSEQSERRVVAS